MAFAYRWLTSDFATAGQMAADDLAQAAAAGFRSVINNRPDFEAGPLQPTSDTMQQAAEAAGVRYAFLPVQSSYQTPRGDCADARSPAGVAEAGAGVLPLGSPLGKSVPGGAGAGGEGVSGREGVRAVINGISEHPARLPSWSIYYGSDPT